jgi:hypothetical protein
VTSNQSIQAVLVISSGPSRFRVNKSKERLLLGADLRLIDPGYRFDRASACRSGRLPQTVLRAGAGGIEGVSSAVQGRMVSIRILLIADAAIAAVAQWVDSAPRRGWLCPGVPRVPRVPGVPGGASYRELAHEAPDESGGLQ